MGQWKVVRYDDGVALVAICSGRGLETAPYFSKKGNILEMWNIYLDDMGWKTLPVHNGVQDVLCPKCQN